MLMGQSGSMTYELAQGAILIGLLRARRLRLHGAGGLVARIVAVPDSNEADCRPVTIAARNPGGRIGR